MHRLPLLLAFVAVLGSVASAVLFFRIGNSKQVLEQRLADANTRAAHLDSALAAANEQNGALKTQRLGLESELQQSREKLAAVESRAEKTDRDLAQAGRDLSQTRSVLALYEQTAQALAQEISGLRGDIDELRTTHAPPETIAAYKSAIAELEKQLAAARTGATAPSATAPATAVFTSRAGRATILTVGPSSSFVVLNFGSARGGQVGQRLTVTQNSAEIATLMISDVRANYSVAQVMPDSLRGVLQKGDVALLVR